MPPEISDDRAWAIKLFLIGNMQAQGLDASVIATAISVPAGQIRSIVRRNEGMLRAERERLDALVATWNEMQTEACRDRDLRSRAAKGRARALARGSRAEDVDLRRVIKRSGMFCHLCGGPVAFAELHFDHIVALAAGGDHTEDNLAVAHSSCNIGKGAR